MLDGGQNVTTDEYVKSHLNIVGQVVYDLLSPSPVPSGLLIQPTNNEEVYLEVDVILLPTNNSTGVVAVSTPGLRGSISTWSNDTCPLTSEPIYLELPVQPHVQYTDNESQHNGLSYGLMEEEWGESSTKFGYWGSATPIPNVPVGAVEAVGDVSISGGGGDGGNSGGGNGDGGDMSGGWGGGNSYQSISNPNVILPGLGGGRAEDAPPAAAAAAPAIQANGEGIRNALAVGTCVIIVDVPADGNCLYHGMAFSTNQIDRLAQLNSQNLRVQLQFAHLSDSRHLQNAGLDGEANIEEYVAQNAFSNSWGGVAEVRTSVVVACYFCCCGLFSYGVFFDWY